MKEFNINDPEIAAEFRMENYRDTIYCTPEETEFRKRLHQAAKEYHERCDAYDAAVCPLVDGHGGRDHLPVTPEQMSAVNRHALRVRKEVISKHHLTSQEFQEALRAFDTGRSRL